MPNAYNNFFLPATNFAGSSGYSTGARFPSIYPSVWDTGTRQVRSNNPDTPGYDLTGRLKSAAMTPAGAVPGGYSPTRMPGLGAGTPGQAQLLGGAAGAGAAGAPGYNPYYTVSNVKSPEVQTEISKLLAELNTLRGQNPTQMVTDAMKAADPAYQQYLGQETGAVGGWFDGDVQKQLDALRAQRGEAYKGATGRALDDLSRVLALGQMGQGGGATVGTSSYLQKQALDTAANLSVQEGLDQATQGRTDLMALLAGQQSNLGTRAGLTTNDIQRQLLPSQVSSQWFNNLLTGAGGVANLQLANNFYGLGGGDPAGQVSSVSIPNYLPNGGAPMPVPGYPANSPTIRPQYAPTAPIQSPAAAPAQLSPLDQLRQKILAEAKEGNYNALDNFRNQARWNPNYAPAPLAPY